MYNKTVIISPTSARKPTKLTARKQLRENYYTPFLNRKCIKECLLLKATTTSYACNPAQTGWRALPRERETTYNILYAREGQNSDIDLAGTDVICDLAAASLVFVFECVRDPDPEIRMCAYRLFGTLSLCEYFCMFTRSVVYVQ